MIRSFTTFYLLCLATWAFSQKTVFQAQPVKMAFQPALSEQFHAWEVVQLDANALDKFVHKAGNSSAFTLDLGGSHAWDISLEARDLRSSHYVSNVLTDEGVKSTVPGKNTTFRGRLAQEDHGWSVALTIDQDFIYGFIKDANNTYLIEPLWYFVPGQPKDLFVVYAASDVKPKPGANCGYGEMLDRMEKLGYETHKDHDHDPAEKVGMCFEIELAIAADLSMFNKYGSAAGVNGHTFGVMNNVQTNYDDEFNDELLFVIVEQFVVTPPATDPWTNSTDAGELLDDFTDWGPNGFNSNHDLGQLWTNRNFQGGTVGIAWLNAVCTSIRYHCLQDFTSNAQQLRVMTAHEIGHNFSATHDPQGSNTIMAPSVTTSTVWSNQSLNQINNFYPTRWCLTLCSTPAAPLADFTGTPTVGCAPLSVAFSDLSTNTPIAWSWSFPGGAPANSIQQNPTILYTDAGTYDVALTASNFVGSNTITKPGYITVETAALASFTFSQVGLTVVFTNTSSANATSYFWDFGDGNTSNLASPVHTYATDGNYVVTLTASNLCGQSVDVQSLSVFVAPTAGFSALPTSGCPGMQVSFLDQSSQNVTAWSWSFPGGTPSSSSQQFPVITYATPGTYPVTLTVSNPAGTNTVTQTNYITVGTVPVPQFTASVNGTTVTFTNNTTNTNGLGAVSYLWNFGDGNTSTAANPTHTYATNGTYTVTLTATNTCGNAIATQQVTIVVVPMAAFNASTTSGCAALTVNFTSTSIGAASYNWSFPGGSPSSSTVQNPTVTYALPGTYSVTLIVTNSAGNDTLEQNNLVTVLTTASASFTSSTSGTTTSFTNTSTNATSYSWDFGDGGTSAETNPVHTYATDGTYTVVLSATNSCGSVTSTQAVTIVTVPGAAFSASNTTGCGPLAVQYNNLSSANATSYNWSFPGGSPASSTFRDPIVTYTMPGTYGATLIAGNSAGFDTITVSSIVTVNALPAAGFTGTSNVFVANFTNTSTNSTAYSWDFGDGGSSSDTNPMHTYAADGAYTVVLTATNACGTATYTQTITITSLPQAGFSAAQTGGCAPFTVQFQDLSSSNATAWNWSFPGGSPNSSTAQNPSVTYSMPGTYDVSLTVTNALGQNMLNQPGYITVGGVPTAGFSSNTNLLAASFTNGSAGATSYAWTFGDGATSSEANPTHTYAADGTYTVVLNATNSCGTVSYTETLTVVSMPTANFGAGQTTGCAPFAVMFDNQSSANATGFEWSFPGGSPATSTAENPTVTYSAAGTYTVTLVAINAAGESTVTQSNLIAVGDVPDAVFGGDVNGLTVTFTNASTNANSYLWSFGDGSTSTDASPSHTYAADGVYEVTLTAINDCGETSVDGQFTLVTAPTAGFSTAVTKGCSPFEVQFSNESSENAVSFAWEFPGGSPAVSNEENPVVTYSLPGVYNVTLTVSNAAGNDNQTLVDYIQVGTVPVAGFTSAVTGAAVDFTNNSTNATSYAWDFGDGNTSQEANPQHVYQSDDAFTVTLTATNECGSVTATQLVVIATQGPVAAFTTEGQVGCAPFDVNFQNLSSDNAESFLWTFPGGIPNTSNEENPTVTYTQAGTYDVTLVAINPQGSDTYTQSAYITVGIEPAAAFVYTVLSDTVKFTNQSLGGTSYEWDFGDNTTSTEENPTHSYTANGEYDVTLTVTNECGFATMTQKITIVLNGTNDLPGITGFNVYPNPNSGSFTVTLTGLPQNSVTVSVTNLLGQRLVERPVDFRSGHFTEAFRLDLPAGMYVLLVESNGQSAFRKIVVE